MEEPEAPRSPSSAGSELLCHPVPLGSFGFFEHVRGTDKTTYAAVGA